MKINKSTLKLSAFDVDGTLCTQEGCPETILKGVEFLRSKNVGVTVVTGRGFYRLSPAFGTDYRNVISPNVLLGIEHGGRITDIEGKSIVYNQLNQDEVKQSLTYILSQEKKIKFVGYFPKGIMDRAKMFAFDETEVTFLKEYYSSFADVFFYDKENIANFFSVDKPCMIMIKPKDNSLLTKNSLLNITENEGFFYIMKKGINKMQCLENILELMNIKSNELLIAGNGINDLDMLSINAKYKVFVGDEFKNNTKGIKNLNYVLNPKKLGIYLNKLNLSF